MPRKPKVTLQTVNDNVLLVLNKVDTMNATFDTMLSNPAATKPPQGLSEEFLNTLETMEANLSHIPAIETHLSNIESQLPGLNATIDNLEAIGGRINKKLDRMIEDSTGMQATIHRIQSKPEKVFGLPRETPEKS